MVNAIKNRTKIWKLAVLLILSMMFIGSAQAFTMNGLLGSKNQNEKLNDIDEKVQLISGNMRLMKFINSNMFDQDVKIIGFYITEDGKILRTYYIVRANDKSGAASLKNDVSDKKGLWKFNPNVKQSLKGLDLAENGLYLYDNRHSLESKSKIPFYILKGLYFYSGIDKENIPSFSKMVKKSNCRVCKKALNLISWDYS